MFDFQASQYDLTSFSLQFSGGSGRSLGTATNEDTCLIWWYRLGRQSAYLHQFSISRPWLTAKPRTGTSIFIVILKWGRVCFQFDQFQHMLWRWQLLDTLSGHFTNPFLSGVMEVFLHVRCIPQQNSQWQFWASVLVTSVRQDAVSPSGNTSLGRLFDPSTWSLNLNMLNLVICLSLK